MRRIVILLMAVTLTLASAQILSAEEEGKDNLSLAAGILRPSLDWPLSLFAATGFAAGREALYFPVRLGDLLAYPSSYYRDYDTGDFWIASRVRPIAPPELRALPAIPRLLKDSEQPRLLPDTLRPDAQE